MQISQLDEQHVHDVEQGTEGEGDRDDGMNQSEAEHPSSHQGVSGCKYLYFFIYLHLMWCKVMKEKMKMKMKMKMGCIKMMQRHLLTSMIKQLMIVSALYIYTYFVSLNVHF